jgi:N-acetylneuraminic acid mutarotase
MTARFLVPSSRQKEIAMIYRNMIWRNVNRFAAIRVFALTTVFASGLTAFAGTSGTWALTGSLNTARWNHTATLLQNGEVLVAGGWGAAGTNDPLASAELYNPATGKWTFTGSMTEVRSGQAATLLQNGEVLVVCGNQTGSSCTAELYNRSTGKWTTTGSMISPGYPDTMTLLPDGEVLATGGETGYEGDTSLATAELYNPSTGT